VALGILAILGPAAAAEGRPAAPPPAPAPAAEPAPASASGAEEKSPEDVIPVPGPIVARKARLTHDFQLGVSAMPGTGYRVIVPYQDGKGCGDHSGASLRPVCTSAIPTFLDLQIAFGITPQVDFVTDLRLGLERDFAHQKQFAVAPGFRFWMDAEENLKFFTTLQGVIDHSPSPGVASNDFAIRNANGMMYDFLKNVGIFLQIGETLGVLRWLRMEFDVGAGVQLRFP
jgi:hypothetical protein